MSFPDEEIPEISKEQSFEINSLYKSIVDSSHTVTQCPDSEEPEELGESYLGNNARKLLLACQHTKDCAMKLNQALKNLGVASGPFKLDDFVTALKMSSEDQVGGYSTLLAVRRLAATAAFVSKPAVYFRTLIGSLDKETVIGAMAPPTPKPEKVKITRKKNEAKEENVTQSEIMNATTSTSQQDPKAGTSEGLAIDVLKSIKNKCKNQDTPPNMLEVVCAETVPDVISRLFGIAFVVRDGHVGLSLGQGQGSKVDTNAALMVRPEKPPVKASKDDKSSRRQYIASYSAKFLKTLVESDQANS